MLKHIKAVNRETIVMMLTNHTDEFVRNRCLAAGADFFLNKAIEFEQVPHIFRRLSDPRNPQSDPGELP